MSPANEVALDPGRALAELARLVEARPPGGPDASQVLALALQVSGATGAFLARREGSELALVQAATATGERLEVPARALERVLAALQEALDGVRDAPPSMTGGEAPPGAVAVKAEAGQPPVHAFPLLDPHTGALLGTLGLHPDPVAPDLAGEGQALLRVLARIVAPLPAGPEERGAGGGGQGFKYSYDEIVTRAEAMRAVFRRLDRVIGMDVPVLIQGETGTGKELVARALHRNDPVRRGKRFYAQNCAAISQTLLESELFGHEKGAFTGAERRKKGLFEIADGSTLFLDEIGEMTLDMQTKLLRVLQEGEVVPVGATEPVTVAVRLVAATHRDLEAEVERGRFRSDLYYRLKVVRVALPALRERPEDIPLLIDHFLRRVARERGERAKVLDRRDERVMEAILRYPWPGNVRELENTVQRMALLCNGDVITYEQLAEEPAFQAEESPQLRPVRPLEAVVEEVERAEIDNALRATEGNRTQAAAMLGINRRSLLRRLQKYGYQTGEDEAE